MSRLTRTFAYLLVLVLAVELALWGAFLVGARPFGSSFPVAAVVAGVGNLGLGVAGGRLARRVVGAVVPGLVWLALALALASMRPEGDTVVPATLRGYAFLAVGAITAAVAIGFAMGHTATPEGQDGR